MKYEPLSAEDICFILNNNFKFTENYNNNLIFTLIGSLQQFEYTIEKFKNSKATYLGCIINYNFHWSLIFIKKSHKYKIFYYNSYGCNIKNSYFLIIKKRIKYFIFLYNTIRHQFDNFSCGIFVIIVFLLLFFLINKNIQSLNKIKYIIETNNINYIVHKFQYILINSIKK